MLPAFCRVAMTLTPSPDSDIRIEVWLPDSAAWNGKFQAVGNGGWAGTIAYPAMATRSPRVMRRRAPTRARREHRVVRARASGKGDRHRLPRGARDDGARKGRRSTATTTARRSIRTSTAARSADARASPKRSAIPPTTTASSPARSRGAAWIATSACIMNQRGDAEDVWRLHSAGEVSTPCTKRCCRRATVWTA